MLGVSVTLAMLIQAASTTPVVATAPAGDDEMVCRRIEVTGSLVRRERVCKTRGEWRRLADSGNAGARAIVEHSTGRPPGGP